jgi:hypothetical protein
LRDGIPRRIEIRGSTPGEMLKRGEAAEQPGGGGWLESLQGNRSR